MMNKDYAKAFKTIVIMAVLLALLSAVVIPLSLSQQISDLSSLRQTSQEQTAQQDGEHSEHHADREELWKSQITPPTAGTLAALGGIAVLWLALGIYYNPGNKTIQRIYDKETGKIIADLICLVDEEFDEKNSLLLFDPIETWKKTHLAPGTYTMRELLVPIFKNGECVYESPKVMDIREYCKKEQETLWDESRRLVNPHEIHVDLSNELWHMKAQLLDSYHYTSN